MFQRIIEFYYLHKKGVTLTLIYGGLILVTILITIGIRFVPSFVDDTDTNPQEQIAEPPATEQPASVETTPPANVEEPTSVPDAAVDDDVAKRAESFVIKGVNPDAWRVFGGSESGARIALYNYCATNAKYSDVSAATFLGEVSIDYNEQVSRLSFYLDTPSYPKIDVVYDRTAGTYAAEPW